MSHPNGFSMVRVKTPSPFLCDVCTGDLSGGWHIETFVGGAGQSVLCASCAEDASKVVVGERMKKARAARKPR